MVTGPVARCCPSPRTYNESVLRKVLQTIERHSMFARGDRVGVAVSGGADSVCLLHVLVDLAREWDLSLHVLHVDHNLRGAESCGDAEFVRDNALTAAGLIVLDDVGGPSVKPYQPDGLWEDVTVNRAGHYVADTGDGLYRRSLYTFWKRTCPPPALATFDAPNREVCVARRARTNTPLQALILLNDTTYVEAARKLAEQVMSSDAGFGARLSNAFRMTVAREPSDQERQILSEMYESSLARFDKNPVEAEKLLKVGRAPRDASRNQQELAAWTVVCSTLLNLDETISRR